ncbi:MULTISPECIES: DMT family transporter [unclassified Yoonia]|uniref:DMT family transporter n=1 Tax=unclassified Yoonia TaxID=2629118 RepID=UPI002AFDCDCB|nr:MULTISPECIES: DMT family transporter [unclassified Yoonia]
MSREHGTLTLALVALGAGWGLTQPLTKITVTGGYEPFGMIFWQMLTGTLLLGTWRWRTLGRLPVTPRTLAFWLMIATLGTLIPNSASYRAAFHLPAGVMSIVISTIPLVAFPIALALGNDRFSWRRMVGLALGLAAVAFIALPEASLPDRAMVAFLPLALIAPFCYAVEGNIVAKWGTAGLDPVQVLFGASAIGVVIALPLALATDQFRVPTAPFILADFTMLLGALIHVVVYTGYIWLVGRGGAVFAGQISYLVTGFGVVWAMLLLREHYSLWVWAALAAMLVGLTLVRPRVAEAPVTGRALAHD